jgi:hypothetical protein
MTPHAGPPGFYSLAVIATLAGALLVLITPQPRQPLGRRRGTERLPATRRPRLPADPGTTRATRSFPDARHSPVHHVYPHRRGHHPRPLHQLPSTQRPPRTGPGEPAGGQTHMRARLRRPSVRRPRAVADHRLPLAILLRQWLVTIDRPAVGRSAFHARPSSGPVRSSGYALLLRCGHGPRARTSVSH